MYWYVLRLLLAVPIGVAVSGILTKQVAGLVAFGLGTFPIDSLMRLIRRLTLKQLNDAEVAQDEDQLIHLEGVTVQIASTLAAENISSIDQLIGMDPILLAIRTGLPFKLMLRLGSQAVVRRYLGSSASRLVPLGLADAEPIVALLDMLDATGTNADIKKQRAQAALNDAVMRLRDPSNPTSPSKDTLELIFREIEAESYTQFLLGNQDAEQAQA